MQKGKWFFYNWEASRPVILIPCIAWGIVEVSRFNVADCDASKIDELVLNTIGNERIKKTIVKNCG